MKNKQTIDKNQFKNTINKIDRRIKKEVKSGQFFTICAYIDSDILNSIVEYYHRGGFKVEVSNSTVGVITISWEDV